MSVWCLSLQVIQALKWACINCSQVGEETSVLTKLPKYHLYKQYTGDQSFPSASSETCAVCSIQSWLLELHVSGEAYKNVARSWFSRPHTGIWHMLVALPPLVSGVSLSTGYNQKQRKRLMANAIQQGNRELSGTADHHGIQCFVCEHSGWGRKLRVWSPHEVDKVLEETHQWFLSLYCLTQGTTYVVKSDTTRNQITSLGNIQH